MCSDFCLDDARFYMAELCEALIALHQHNIVHRDLKPVCAGGGTAGRREGGRRKHGAVLGGRRKASRGYLKHRDLMHPSIGSAM